MAGLEAEFPDGVNVTEAGAGRDIQTLDIEEVQFLVGTPEDPVYHYWGMIGLIRVSSALWMVADGEGA